MYMFFCYRTIKNIILNIFDYTLHGRHSVCADSIERMCLKRVRVKDKNKIYSIIFTAFEYDFGGKQQ